MAEQNSNIPQVTDPNTVADLIRLLQIRGAIGVLNVADIVLPVVNLGDLSPSETIARLPAWRSTDVFSEGVQVTPAAGTVLADTGQLPAGVYDVAFMCSSNEDADTQGVIDFEHRNAANAANLAVWSHLLRNSALATTVWAYYTFGYELAVNERLRSISPRAGSAGEAYSATIFARIR